MRIAACIGATKVIILLDFGSTHNFISAKLVSQLSLPVNQMNKLKVTIVDGGRLSSCGICRGVTWRTQSTSFVTAFFVLPLKGCDMVLDIQWLLSLRTIVWDFSSLKMQHTYEGVPCMLQ